MGCVFGGVFDLDGNELESLWVGWLVSCFGVGVSKRVFLGVFVVAFMFILQVMVFLVYLHLGGCSIC